VNDEFKPRLRPVEVFPTEHEGRRMILVHDPAGLARGVLTVTEPALFILSKFDGQHTLQEIQDDFRQVFGQRVSMEQLEDLAAQLDEQLFLDSPRFDEYVARSEREFNEAPTRQTQPDSGFGVELHQLPIALREIVGEPKPAPDGGRLVALIAPHLDLRRGRECYAEAYRLLGAANHAERFVILGTNHFGRSASVVATRKPFETPLGTAPADGEFLERLNRRCGVDLCERQYDHKREHSVEIQVLFLQYLMYRRPFRIVPALCPDPCGPTGTAPIDGRGVDLRTFAEVLGDEIAADPVPTCIIAGADLSHVGRRFGDDCELTESFLKQVEQTDREALGHIEANEPEAFRRFLAETQNRTRVCSAGSIHALMTALNRAYGRDRLSTRVLRYHQAVDKAAHTCVTCAAVAFTLKE